MCEKDRDLCVDLEIYQSCAVNGQQKMNNCPQEQNFTHTLPVLQTAVKTQDVTEVPLCFLPSLLYLLKGQRFQWKTYVLASHILAMQCNEI